MLCLTGLPLIFHHEIDEALGYSQHPEAAAPGTPKAPIDSISAEALATAPGKVVQYVSWDKDEPGLVFVFTNSAPDGDPEKAVIRTFNAYSGKVLGQVGVGPMLIVLKLHVDMFAGQPGKLFLGGMGLLMFVAVVSGVVLYWPFTRRLQFSTVRTGKSRRVAWLDWHNLIGVTTVVWVSVVGLTGVINTWAELLFEQWKSTELAAMVAPYAGKPPPTHLASLDRVIDNAKIAAPGMTPAFIAFPGTPFSSSHHFAVFMRGDTTLTARVSKPVLVDGETGAASEVRDLPLYLKALLISQPLHFGDYGGMVLKIIWAVLDVLSIIVLGSGLYLWWVKRRKERRGRQLLAVPAISQAAE